MIHAHIYCEMITKIRLMNAFITSLRKLFVPPVVRMFKVYSLSNLEAYNRVLLTIATMPYITSLELTHFITENLYLWINISPFLPSP